MKDYKNRQQNNRNRKQFAKQGATKIKIKKGKVISYINKKGELVEPKQVETKK